MNKDYWFSMNLNSEPWSVGSLSIGKRNGKFYPKMSPNHQLVAFKEAVKEELEQVKHLPTGEYELTFYIWRKLERYQGEKKMVQKNQTDATNLQKALEDGLQGVLFDNDRNVRDIRTIIVEQEVHTEPRIIIRASLWNGLNPNEIPQYVWDQADIYQMKELFQSKSNYEDSEELF